MTRVLKTIDEAAALIREGRPLMVAGDEPLLQRLPQGTWIGGTIPYFIADDGGVCTRDLVQVTELPAAITSAEVARYDASTIDRVFADGAGHGFALIIIPAASATHLEFAVRAPTFEGFAQTPLLGWISGVHVAEIGTAQAKVFDGRTGEMISDGAVVLRAGLPPGQVAEIGIVNIFDLGDGPTIEFEADGFSATHALIDGERHNLAAWITERKLDSRLPLTADYFGARVNVSLQKVDTEAGRVDFYAPVFTGVKYRHARPVADYVDAFLRRVPREDGQRVVFSCNCILNYLYSELEGKRTGSFVGPATFGEIAYQLLNQTLAYLAIHDFG